MPVHGRQDRSFHTENGNSSTQIPVPPTGVHAQLKGPICLHLKARSDECIIAVAPEAALCVPPGCQESPAALQLSHVRAGMRTRGAGALSTQS